MCTEIEYERTSIPDLGGYDGKGCTLDPMSLDLFAGIRVQDYHAGKSWYERLLGREPAFFPNATEAVWELAEHRYVFIVKSVMRLAVRTT